MPLLILVIGGTAALLAVSPEARAMLTSFLPQGQPQDVSSDIGGGAVTSDQPSVAPQEVLSRFKGRNEDGSINLSGLGDQATSVKKAVTFAGKLRG